MNTTSPPPDSRVADESTESPSADPDPPEPCLTVSCDVDADDAPGELYLRDHLLRAIDQLDADVASLNLVVIDDSTMAQMHERYSGVAGTTDVLTFDLRDEPTAPIDGEVYACVDEARRRAAERGHAIEKELLLYGLHGLLHLIGYDDHDEADHKAMHAKEDEILEAIGVGKVFSR